MGVPRIEGSHGRTVGPPRPFAAGPAPSYDALQPVTRPQDTLTMIPARPFPFRAGCLAALLLAAFTPATTLAQGVAAIKAAYTKYEYRIPMRDGKRLFTAVFVPKDDSKKYPILLARTPYSVSPYGVDRYPNSLGPSDHFSKAGYIFVKQDVRGCWMSEGEFVNMRPQ